MIGTLLLVLALQAAEPLKLKRHEFRDVHMGNALAYTALCPDGWTSKGQVEWSAPPLAFPNANFEMNSPDGGRVKFVPMMHFSYTELKNGAMAPQGLRPPTDLGAFIVWAFPQNATRQLSNVALVSDRRDPKAEEANERQAREMGMQPGFIRESHVVTFDFDELGRRWRQEMSITYTRNPPIDNLAVFTLGWSLGINGILSAPIELFEKLKPQLLSVAATVRPDPLWWVRQQVVIGEIQKARADAVWKSIIERGKAIERMSDEQNAAFKKHMGAMDAAQKTRIDGVYERQDYKDTNGDAVNLPIHYKHVYSDGDGNYTLSDRPLQSQAGWTEISPVK